MPPEETTVFVKSSDAWEAMLHDIRNAEKSIDIEQYIFTHDEIGDAFIDALVQKSKQGLKVRLFLDAVGSWSAYKSTLPDELRSEGIQVKFFNPVSPWRVTNFTSNFFRDHRKLMIVDGKIGHIGGVGIRADMAGWRDTHIRIVRTVVLDMQQSFDSIWNGISRWSFWHLPRRRPDIVRHFDLVTNAPMWRDRSIYQALVAAIRGAQKTIYLTSPYFIPDTRLFRVLRLAARRGVDVRIVLPEIADHIFIDYARESYFTLCLKAGIKIYLYKQVMMHAKTAVIDDMWATAGSFNLDSLSFFFNHEANITTVDKHFVETIKQNFFEDLRHSKEVIYTEWIKRSFFRKFLEYISWPLHGIL